MKLLDVKLDIQEFLSEIFTHVKTILEEVLQVDPDRIVEVEDTVTSYGFIGNNRKPFHTLTWLCPKSDSTHLESRELLEVKQRELLDMYFMRITKGFTLDLLID